MGRRHFGRRLGPGARLLHDDRRPQVGGRYLDPIFRLSPPASATFPARLTARKSRARRSWDMYTAARAVAATSSRWSITAWSLE